MIEHGTYTIESTQDVELLFTFTPDTDIYISGTETELLYDKIIEAIQDSICGDYDKVNYLDYNDELSGEYQANTSYEIKFTITYDVTAYGRYTYDRGTYEDPPEMTYDTPENSIESIDRDALLYQLSKLPCIGKYIEPTSVRYSIDDVDYSNGSIEEHEVDDGWDD